MLYRKQICKRFDQSGNPKLYLVNAGWMDVDIDGQTAARDAQPDAYVPALHAQDGRPCIDEAL